MVLYLSQWETTPYTLLAHYGTFHSDENYLKKF